jgi:hypothetical protein
VTAWIAPDALRVGTGASFSSATASGSVGVDFLGTRSANLAMLGELTGVFNNRITSARQHAILAWAAWRFLENCKAASLDPTPSQYRDFIDVVETVQLVGQLSIARDHDVGLGSRSAAQLGDAPDIPLRFAAYGRTHQTSAMAAVQYGPSAKPEGLALITRPPGKGEVWVPTPRGRTLALELDPLLRRATAYDAFTRVSAPERMPRAAAEELGRCGLSLNAPGDPRPERDTYAKILFRLEEAPDVRRDRRPLTLALILDTVQALDGGNGASADQVRRVLLAGDSGRTTALPEYLAATAKRWQLFQLRQLQRYALEVWLGACERWMFGGEVDVERMVKRIAADEDAASLEAICSEVPRHDLGAIDPWGMIADADKLLRAGDADAAAALALHLTLAVLDASERLVPSTGSLWKFASTGGAQRMAIPFFLAWWKDRERFRLDRVTAEMLTELVLEQHTAVAMARFDGLNRRLRFGKDEHGWMLLPGTTPTVPTLTPDRIAAMLALLADLGLVERVTGDAFRVTASGVEILGAVEARWAKQPDAVAA